MMKIKARPKVLVVDDREDNLLAYEVALRGINCEPVKVLSGRKALEQVASTEFAVVLLDVQMPDLDGFETAQMIRKLPNGKLLPILFVTAGMHDAAIFKKAHASGAIDFLSKPIDTDVLCTKVQLFIELYEARQIIRSQTESRAFLNGDGFMPSLFRQKDWANTPLGGLNDWPQSLRTAVSILLQSRFPMFISWGHQRIFLYNDAYTHILGKKHPTAFGQPFREVWSDIWNDIEPLILKVDHGQSVFLEDLKLIMNRNGFDEETFFTFSYSPIRGEAGQVDGLFCAVMETSSRIKSEQNLRIALDKIATSEQTLNQIFEESPAFMALVEGPDHRFVRANRKYYEVTGRQETILGKTVAEVFPEIKNQGILEILEGVRQTRQAFHGVEIPLRIQKGTEEAEVFFDFVYQPLLTPHGEMIGIMCQGTDVTYQVMARRKAEESDRDFRLALESARMGTWRIDLATNRIDVSPQLAEILGIDANDQNLADVIRNGIHEEDRETTASRLKYAADHKSAYVNEYRAINRDGEMRWFSSRGNVVCSADGKAYSLSGVTVDITDRKLGELALERNARLVEAMPQPFMAMDADWTINYWNPAASEVIGIESSEVIGRNLFVTFPGLRGTSFHEAYAKTLRDKVRVSVESYYPDLEKWFHATSFPFDGGIAVAFMDISVQKHTEKVLADAKLEAEKASALKSAFLANMSHEIRTPLGAMIGFADLLKDPDLDSTERSGYIDIITRNGNQLALLINDILDLSKVESGHLHFESQELNVEQLVKEVVSLLHINAKDKNLSLRMKIDPRVPAKIMTDPARLKQILVNIVGNAIKFTPMGNVSIQVYEKLSEQGDSLIAFEVKDTGIGIPFEKRGRLFQVFSQADESITRKYGGTGLGLALSKKLANGLGGDVVLSESSDGGGSTFIATVKNSTPVHREIVSPQTQIENQRQQIVSNENSLGPLRVLLIEDSPDNQQLIWHILAKKGAKIEIAENGVVGVSMALQGQYDIVLMDIQMPLMDGYTATQRLREYGFTKPIIALTAHAMSEIRQKCLQVGCTDHLPKPINAVDLVNVVSKHTTATSEPN